MPVEFIGYIGNFNASEAIARQGPIIDRAPHRGGRSHPREWRLRPALLAFHSTSPESILVGQYVDQPHRRLKLMIAHRPGFTAPTVAARQLATLDHLTGGRVVGPHHHRRQR